MGSEGAEKARGQGAVGLEGEEKARGSREEYWILGSPGYATMD